MSKAREIAEERLARGEITREEFDEIIARLSGSPPSNVTPMRPASAKPSTLSVVPDTQNNPSDDPAVVAAVHEFFDEFERKQTAEFLARNLKLNEQDRLADEIALKMVGGHVGAGFALAILTFVGGNLLSSFVSSDPERVRGLLQWIAGLEFIKTPRDGLWLLLAMFTGAVILIGMLLGGIVSEFRCGNIIKQLNRLSEPRAVLTRLPFAMKRQLMSTTAAQYRAIPPTDLAGRVLTEHLEVKYNATIPIALALLAYWLQGVYNVDALLLTQDGM